MYEVFENLKPGQKLRMTFPELYNPGTPGFIDTTARNGRYLTLTDEKSPEEQILGFVSKFEPKGLCVDIEIHNGGYLGRVRVVEGSLVLISPLPVATTEFID